MLKQPKGLRITITLFMSVLMLIACSKTQSQVETSHKKVSLGKQVTQSMFWDFENASTGAVSDIWKTVGTWQIQKDKTAPSGEKILTMAKPDDSFMADFNLCWTDTVHFLDGEIEVKFKALTGKEDQGGGIMWRVQDNDNYYVVRFNPLEDNFRFYYVRSGFRRMISSAKVALPIKKWHTLKIVQKGNHFEAYLNGQKYLDDIDDHFTQAGGVGLWTKADAVTSFDNLSIKPLKR